MIIQRINQFILSYDVYDIRHVIARYIKVNMSKIVNMTLTQIADECNVSKGMMSKFIKELGYLDCVQFKNACNEFLNRVQKEKLVEINNIQEELSTSLDYFITVAKHNNQCLNEQALNYFFEDVSSSNFLYVYGKDDYEILAYRMQMILDYMNSFEKLGFIVIFISDIKKQRIIQDDSVFLSFSNDIIPEIKEMFNNCIFWYVNDFFNNSSTLTIQYLFYFLDTLSQKFYVHKL